MKKNCNPAYYLGGISILAILVLSTVEYWGHNPYISSLAIVILIIMFIFTIIKMRREGD